MSREMMADGGPAFPQNNDAWHSTVRGFIRRLFARGGTSPPVPCGMSLRQWYAGMATDEDVRTIMDARAREALCPCTRSEVRFMHADAMVKEGDKP